MKYNLLSNQADRMNFDAEVRNWARDVAREADFFSPDDDTIRADYLEPSAASLEVDDLDEAEVRYIEAFRDAYKRAILSALADEICQIKEPVVVFDTGHEIMGIFPSGNLAADYLYNAEPDRWAMTERPVCELLADVIDDHAELKKYRHLLKK